jgi:hypothetical protein
MSNLPPGVTTSMLPGNRPGELAWEKLTDDFITFLDEHGIGPYADDDDATSDLYFAFLNEVLLNVTQNWTRDPYEEAVRKMPCADCKQVLGAEYSFETRVYRHRGIEGWEQHSEDVAVHKVCPTTEGS